MASQMKPVLLGSTWRFVQRHAATRFPIPSSTAPTRRNPWLDPDRRWFHLTSRRRAVTPYMLADIGEGITECQLIEWFIKPGDRVEQFSKICEVQSDKASVEVHAHD